MNLYLVCATKKNANVMLMFVFLHKLIEVRSASCDPSIGSAVTSTCRPTCKRPQPEQKTSADTRLRCATYSRRICMYATDPRMRRCLKFTSMSSRRSRFGTTLSSFMSCSTSSWTLDIHSQPTPRSFSFTLPSRAGNWPEPPPSLRWRLRMPCLGGQRESSTGRTRCSWTSWSPSTFWSTRPGLSSRLRLLAQSRCVSF